MSKRDKPRRKSRFVAQPEEMIFCTPEEADAFAKKSKAEIAAYVEKMKSKKDSSQTQTEDENSN